MMHWLIRATQVTGLTYRLLLTTMMTVYLLREGVKGIRKEDVPRLPPPPQKNL
jgi:hypothetical protein